MGFWRRTGRRVARLRVRRQAERGDDRSTREADQLQVDAAAEPARLARFRRGREPGASVLELIVLNSRSVVIGGATVQLNELNASDPGVVLPEKSSVAIVLRFGGLIRY